MDLKDFVRLVAKMRKAQREYFRTRDPAVLEESKALEREVDAAVKELADDRPRLF